MTTFYTEMQQMADEMLREFGETEIMTLIREAKNPSDDEFNPGPAIRSEWRVVGVIKLAYRYKDSVEAGSFIQENRRDIILSAFELDGTTLPVTPKAGDKINVRNYDWTVTAGVPVAPGGVPIVYKIAVEK